MPSLEQIKASISGIKDPQLQIPLFDIHDVEVSQMAGRTQLLVTWSYYLGAQMEQVFGQLRAALEADDLAQDIDLSIVCQVQASASTSINALPGVKNIVAVASGKGGVGKSTTAVNLALALSADGANVGILDADIYGPSQALMLGVNPGTRPRTINEQAFEPIMAAGLQLMTMAVLVDEDTPMVWRGPMASGALQQMLLQTQWQDLDYLIVDMPPGTGDIQLTLSQKAPLSGAVIVTTPQDIALLDARRGVEMFNKVDVPVLGVIENMSTHICSSCGHQEAIFGSQGGEKIAQQYEVDVLGALPLALNIRQQTDAGQPTVMSDPESAEAQLYVDCARAMAARLAWRTAQGDELPELIISDD